MNKGETQSFFFRKPAFWIIVAIALILISLLIYLKSTNKQTSLSPSLTDTRKSPSSTDRTCPSQYTSPECQGVNYGDSCTRDGAPGICWSNGGNPDGCRCGLIE